MIYVNFEKSKKKFSNPEWNDSYSCETQKYEIFRHLIRLKRGEKSLLSYAYVCRSWGKII